MLASVGTAPNTDYSTAVERLLRRVDEPYRNKCRKIFDGDNMTFAQGWQDWYLWHNVYRHKESNLVWGGGFYLDIGTNHPTQASNTLFFDKCLGWQGVCFEPQDKYHGLIKRHRSCKLVPSCVLGSSQSVIFSGYGPAARLIDVVSATDPQSTLESKDKYTGRKRCVVASEALEALGFLGRGVDLLSIDIEGAESSVLRCWPFASLHVRAILMETEKYAGDILGLNRFFHRHGYANVETFSVAMQNRPAALTDNLFVRQEPLPVYPAMRTDDREARGGLCPHGLREHMHWWCAPFMVWEPESKLWGQCRNASARAGIAPAPAGTAPAASAAADAASASAAASLAEERESLAGLIRRPSPSGGAAPAG